MVFMLGRNVESFVGIRFNERCYFATLRHVVLVFCVAATEIKTQGGLATANYRYTVTGIMPNVRR